MEAEPTTDDNNKSNNETTTVTLDTTGVSFTPNSGPSTGTNTPTGRKTPVKPALKAFSSVDEEEDNDQGYERKKKATKKKKKNRKLQWDEAKIQEHDQLRGTRMKIDEPNTPFAQYDSGSETDGSLSSNKGNSHHKISWDALTNKLEAHATAVAAYPPSSPSSHGDAITDNEEDNESQKRERQRAELQRLEFQEHRKRHYNEMEVVRRFRRDHPDGVPTSNGHHSSEESDNDGDDENE